MAKRSIFLILTLFYSFSINPCYSETDTLLQGQELKDWDYLISSNKVFTLKFFGFKSTISPYLGIFYNPERITHYDRGRYDSNSNDREKAVWVANRNNPIPSRDIYGYDRGRYDSNSNDREKAVWVANRNNPIPSRDIYGKLIIDIHGKLSILSVLDLFSPPTKVVINASATLLDTGNFVLQELNPDGSVKRVLWQSFDYPTDTLLPGMKLGINLKTGHQWSLTSWRTEYLPADGPFTLTGDPNRTGQIVILRGGKIHWRSGAWQINGGFKNAELQYSGPDVRLHYVSNDAEQSFTYLTKNYDLSPALTMNLDGRLNSSTLYGSMVNFEPHSTFGLASRLDIQCLSKSDPVSGCAEYDFKELECRKYYEFHKEYENIYGDEYEYDESYNLTSYDCRTLCWNNCSCMAYIYGATCKTFGQRIYNDKPWEAKNDQFREFYAIVYRGPYREVKEDKKWILFMIGIGSLLSILTCYFLYKKLQINGKAVIYAMLLVFLEVKKILKQLLRRLRHLYNYIRTDKKINAEVHYFTFQSISSATNNFSTTNKLGEGGFGAVFKGKLVDGQEVAVKRLSTSSDQGVKEFKNEIELIAKLQHTNLVRLLGCCIEKKEKILVYEYMPNKSLDFFLFGIN